MVSLWHALGMGHLFVEQESTTKMQFKPIIWPQSFLSVAQADRSKQNIELVYSLFDIIHEV